jgi:hypothetical protein
LWCSRRHSLGEDAGVASNTNMTVRVFPHCFVHEVQCALGIVRYADHVGVVFRKQHHFKSQAQSPTVSQRNRRSRAQSCIEAFRTFKSPTGYWITSSAKANSPSRIVSPSGLAVLRLMMNSYLVGSITGRSAGFAPLRIRLAY